MNDCGMAHSCGAYLLDSLKVEEHKKYCNRFVDLALSLLVVVIYCVRVYFGTCLNIGSASQK
jgi:hypothetical protein